MEPITTLGALVTWAWPVVASGVAGNAAYDGVKALLGSRFGKYQAYAEQGKEEVFKEVLQDLLETNEALTKQLMALANGDRVQINSISGDIMTGNITSNGSVTVGHSIK